MKKILWGILPLFLFCGSLSAQNDQTEYMVFLSSAGEQSVPLTDLKKIVFQGGSLVVEKKNNTTERFALNSLNKMFFRLQTTGIQAVVKQDNLFVWNAQQAQLFLAGISGGSSVIVSSANGMVVCRQQIASEGGQLSLRHLPKGIYIVTYAGKTLKIVKS